MSNQYLPGDEAGGDEPATVRALGELAGSVETGTVPYDRLVAGGRRRLRRRRLLTAGVAAALVAGIAGGTAVLGERGRQAVSTVVAASATDVAVPGSAGGTATPKAPGARDPFNPTRVKVGEGTANGHAWEAWVALWPTSPTKEGALKQAQLIRAERYAVNPDVKPVRQSDVDSNWDAGIDEVNYYYTVDGKRQADDSVHAVSSPGGYPAAVGGASLGLKHATGIPPVVIEGVRAEVAKVAVDWKTGGTTEAVPVAVGDSPFRYYGVVAKPGTDAAKITQYAADGSVVSSTDSWLRTS
ncbi:MULTISPECIES: hypothetical protein [Streptomycetaceae]|uniref:hypothetical protein n=1 Tax=Streptomycetaceae TaxID=2062 RepID=UPI0009393ABD|nr:hypothetical protein [Streptomyces sp. CB02056]OKI08975.1 hypothetical protein AMK13_11520 [Streptomyces sp. CB02056]